MAHLRPVGRVRVGPADLGRRVTVRYRDPGDDRVTDVVGVLQGWHDGVLAVRRRGGEFVPVPESALVAARVVPPEVSAYAVQALAETGWVAGERERVGPWLLRWDHDVTRRANSALVGEPVSDLPDRLAAVTRWYAQRGSPARLQLPEPWPDDDRLDALGWRREAPCWVLTAAAADLAVHPTGRPGGVRVELHDEPDQGWLSLVTGLTQAQRAVLAAIVSRSPGRRFATAYDRDGTRLGIGRASLDRGDGLTWSCLTNLTTVPQARRRGVARAVTTALARWAGEQGATTAYLQVEVDNAPARRLYDSLGFAPHHRYAYRVAPPAP